MGLVGTVAKFSSAVSLAVGEPAKTARVKRVMAARQSGILLLSIAISLSWNCRM